jgi:hypothetical protein
VHHHGDGSIVGAGSIDGDIGVQYQNHAVGKQMVRGMQNVMQRCLQAVKVVLGDGREFGSSMAVMYRVWCGLIANERRHRERIARLAQRREDVLSRHRSNSIAGGTSRPRAGLGFGLGTWNRNGAQRWCRRCSRGASCGDVGVGGGRRRWCAVGHESGFVLTRRRLRLDRETNLPIHQCLQDVGRICKATHQTISITIAQRWLFSGPPIDTNGSIAIALQHGTHNLETLGFAHDRAIIELALLHRQTVAIAAVHQMVVLVGADEQCHELGQQVRIEADPGLGRRDDDLANVVEILGHRAIEAGQKRFRPEQIGHLYQRVLLSQRVRRRGGLRVECILGCNVLQRYQGRAGAVEYRVRRADNHVDQLRNVGLGDARHQNRLHFDARRHDALWRPACGEAFELRHAFVVCSLVDDARVRAQQLVALRANDQDRNHRRRIRRCGPRLGVVRKA